ncbi:hypothetical protein [Raoultella ornithinolytica]|uniref:hypothetical protein n=1 Tax=Raoultella ornithinolytica TaxID=54291 RepID=UPI002350769E|nr:hypothetical protein [Raoultella ornithinolytica]MDC7941330.1 hypothetical protein [Raoultella ornithinolytica]
MKIEFHEDGFDSTVTITSTAFEFRLHNRMVDTVLFVYPSVHAKRRGFFILKTVITGRPSHVLRAFIALKAEASR